MAINPSTGLPRRPARPRTLRLDLQTIKAFHSPGHPHAPTGHPDAPLAAHDLQQINRPNDSNTQPSDLTPAQRRLHAQRTFAQIFHEPEASLADLTPYRVRTAHRLIREMARHRAYIRPDEMLIEALEPSFVPKDPEDDDAPEGQDAPDFEPPIDGTSGLTADRWLFPELFTKPAYDQKNPHMRLFMEVVRLMLDAENINPLYQPFQWIAKEIEIDIGLPTQAREQRWFPHHHPGVALLPPAIPYPFVLADGSIRKDYDPANPQHDPALHAFIKIIDTLARALYIEIGSTDDPDSGRYGLAGLLDPTTIRAAFPSRVQMMTWETLLVDETLDLIVKEGMPKTNQILKDKYGLQSIEAQQFLKMAKAKAAHLASGDSEEDRGIMILRLEDASRRAREALDIRAELAALKNLAIVQGLARVDPQDAMSDFLNIVKQVSTSREALAGGASRREMPALPDE